MVVRSNELKWLAEMLIRMGGMVEEAVRDAVNSLVERDSDLARKVIAGDQAINAMDVQIDEECIRLLALIQPMASDLRFVATAIKITTDLERMGDNAVNIAERAVELNKEPLLKPYVDIPAMSEISRGMVRDAINAFVDHDKKLALDVIGRDDEVDELNEAVFEELSAIMARDPGTVRRATMITYVSKYLERIADHATNVAENVVFMVEGKIIRHVDLRRKG